MELKFARRNGGFSAGIDLPGWRLPAFQLKKAKEELSCRIGYNSMD
jgi:hypothetical protein